MCNWAKIVDTSVQFSSRVMFNTGNWKTKAEFALDYIISFSYKHHINITLQVLFWNMLLFTLIKIYLYIKYI